MLAILAPNDQPPSVIGGPGSDFTPGCGDSRFFFLRRFHFRVAGPHEFPIEGVGVIFAVEKPEISQMPN
jgi:hypothetical protein